LQQIAIQIGDDELVLTFIGGFVPKDRIRATVLRVFQDADDFERSRAPVVRLNVKYVAQLERILRLVALPVLG
jgi:hypothetical protein